MRVHTDNLKKASKASRIKDTSPTAMRKNYWNGVHRLVFEDGKFKLKTTDHTSWLEWNIPFDGEPLEGFDTLMEVSRFKHASNIEGGWIIIEDSEGLVTFKKDSMDLRIPKQAQQEYVEPEVLENGKTWKCNSLALSQALKFVTPFIDDSNPQANRSVATAHDGTLIGGNPKRLALVEGLPMEEPMSFKAKSAKMVSSFLRLISEEVLVTVTSGTGDVNNSHYIFEDPIEGHKLIMVAEQGMFPSTVIQSVRNQNFEDNYLDRKTLLSKAKTLKGALPLGCERINFFLQGSEKLGSLRIETPGDNPDFVSHDEFPIIRPENAQDSSYSINNSFLVESLSHFEGDTILLGESERLMFLTDSESEGLKRSVALNKVPVLRSVESLDPQDHESVPESSDDEDE